jgi:predicted nicotinamide N-methyase
MIREIESFDTVLRIEQDLGLVNKELGATIWDCAFVMMKTFENLEKYPEGFFNNKKILELGSGTGIIGIVLLNLGAHVTFTDKEALLPLIELNVKLNCSHLSPDNYKIQELLWGETPITEDYDYVIICDCVYESRDMWLPLAKCLISIAEKNPETKILIGYELRSKKDAAFFPYITQYFTITPHDEEDYHPDFNCLEIKIFTLKWKDENDDSGTKELADVWTADPKALRLAYQENPPAKLIEHKTAA